MDLLHVLRLMVTALAGLLLYCLIVAALVSFVIRGVQRNRPVIAPPEEEPQERRGDRWSAVPGWVAGDRDWAVAVVLLGAPDLAERTEPFVDFAARRIDWLGLRLTATSWPRRERLIVDVAHDLAGGAAPELDEVYPGEPVAISELLGDLDQPHVDLVHAAVDLHRGACTLTYARSVADAIRQPPDPQDRTGRPADDADSTP